MGRHRTAQDSAPDRDDIREIIRDELNKIKNELCDEVTVAVRDALKAR